MKKNTGGALGHPETVDISQTELNDDGTTLTKDEEKSQKIEGTKK